MPETLFFDDLVTPFYSKLGTDYRARIRAGQICHTHIAYSNENRELWRPDGYDGTQTNADLFRIRPAGADAYRRRLPLVAPKLETDEEFPVARAKRRPVVVVRPAPSDIAIPAHPGGPRLSWPLAIVSPTYSVVRKDDRMKFPKEFVARVRKLEFPEFFFLPDCPGALNRDSIAQLTRLTNASLPHLEPTQWQLADEVMEVFLGQVSFYFLGLYEGKYATAREMLLHPA